MNPVQVTLKVPVQFRTPVQNFSAIRAVHCCLLNIWQNSTYPDDGYPDRLVPSGKSVENSTKLPCLEITGYRIKYITVLWLLEIQIRRGRKV